MCGTRSLANQKILTPEYRLLLEDVLPHAEPGDNLASDRGDKYLPPE